MDSDEGGRSEEGAEGDIILGSENPGKRSEIISNEIGMFGGSQRDARPWFMELFINGVRNGELIETFSDGSFRRDNIQKFESKGMILERETEQGEKQYELTELGKEFEAGFRRLTRAARYRAPVGRLLRGFPDETSYIPEDQTNQETQLAELRTKWLPPFEAFSLESVRMPDADDWFDHETAPTTIKWEENPQSESVPRRHCQQLFSNATTIRLFSPWLVPSLPVITNFTTTEKQLRMILGPYTLNNSADSRVWEQLSETNRARDNDISIRGLDYTLPDGSSLRLPYLLAVLDGGPTEDGTVFLWGKGSRSDDYHVTMESTHPDIYEWGDELFGLVENFDCALREVSGDG